MAVLWSQIHVQTPYNCIAKPGPLGSLERLPQEIRDYIYELTLCGRYWARYDGGCFGYRSHVRRLEESNGTRLLATSKAVNREAMRIFQVKSIFLSEICIEPRSFLSPIDVQPDDLGAKLRNMEFELDMQQWLRKYRYRPDIIYQQISGACDESIHAFCSSSNPAKNRATLIVNIAKFEKHEELFAAKAIAQFASAVKSLVCFKRVTVEFIARKRETPWELGAMHRQTNMGHVCLATVAEAMLAEIGSSLGPMVDKSEDGDRSYVFEPRKMHLCRDCSRAAPSEMGPDGETSTCKKCWGRILA